MQQDEVEAFLAHHGVKGMKWGEHKSRADLARGVKTGSRAVATKARSGAKKTGNFVVHHPKTSLAVYGAARLAYVHRGQIVGTAILAGRAGKYIIKKGFEKEPEVASAVALGRQVVQGLVIG